MDLELDSRYAKVPKHASNRADLAATLRPIFATRSRDTWLALFQKAEAFIVSGASE